MTITIPNWVILGFMVFIVSFAVYISLWFLWIYGATKGWWGDGKT
jgi:hypothetical protein